MALDHETRRTGIGGSDIGALLRVSKYRTPMDVFLSKTGLDIDPTQPPVETEPQEWGHRLEPVVLGKLCEVYGVTMLPNPGTVRASFWYHALATPDGVTDTAILEAKTRRSDDGWGASGTRAIPPDVHAQVTWYMGILHKPVAYVGALFSGSEFRHYEIPFDQSYFAHCLRVAQAFWTDHIKAAVPPPLDGSPAGDRWLRVTYPSVDPSTDIADADDYQTGLIRSVLEARQEVERAEALRDRLEQLLKQEIGTKRGLTGTFGTVTWTDVRGRQRTNWEAVAKAAGATPELVGQFTVTGDPSRRFAIKGAK